ncbi:hypothetical protein C0W96_02735 [Photobacterium kishitanii]|uniref:hypothetical protein n=1 Tax=Photobacterium kishitanii TaxID=318456 RepID=UPI0005D35C66|nr:hypothetical protein [Photobacterium kishitanii]KJG10831.1 hypothetical protein UB40_05710 [Photobacterium kishitanii]PSV08189.1 hypothetical protein C0W96_02735 [Photobacterium kishitanii]PSV73763.1 hypothetical protein C0W29_17985 [Photobacterium kishitanii]
MKCFILTLSLLVTASNAYANTINLSWDWATSFISTSQRSTSFKYENHDAVQNFNGLVDVQADYLAWRGVFSIKVDNAYVNDHYGRDWGGQAETTFIIRELVWQDEVTIFGQTWDATVGKVQIDWGVGYGYRTLDLFKPYRQNALDLVAEEGVTAVALSMFDDSGEWTGLYTNSGWNQQSLTDFEAANEQQGVGVRRYGLLGSHEYQLVAYYDDIRQGLLGASWVTLLDQQWSLHSSSVIQNNYYGYQQPLSVMVPVVLEQQGHAWQTLVGVSWASETGHKLIAEYWYDSRAWSRSQWQQAIARSQQLIVAPATTELAYSYAQGFQQTNIVQHNLMLHWQWDLQAWLQWLGKNSALWLADITPTLDILYSPQDNGIIATQWLTYQWLDSGDQAVDLEFSARFFTGENDSAYALVSDNYMIALTVRGRF